MCPAFLQHHLASLDSQAHSLAICCHIEMEDLSWHLLLIGQFESIRFVDFEVSVVGRCHEPRPFRYHPHTADYLLMIACSHQTLLTANVPQCHLIASTANKHHPTWKSIHPLYLLSMVEHQLRLLMDSEVE